MLVEYSIVHMSYTMKFVYAVEALREIAKELGKKDWNFNEDPCSNHTSWFSRGDPARQTYVNQVTCNCVSSRWHLTNM